MTSPVLRSPATSLGAIALRVVALCAGVLLLAGATFISLGAALLVPLGMWVFTTWQRRRGQRVSRSASWLAAISCVAAGVLAISLFMFGSLPGGAMREVQHAADSASTASSRRPPPAWMERVAPGSTARAAHASPIPASLRAPLMLWFLGVMLLFLAGIAGSLGWVGAMLCGYTITGRWLNGPATSEPASFEEHASPLTYPVPS